MVIFWFVLLAAAVLSAQEKPAENTTPAVAEGSGGQAPAVEPALPAPVPVVEVVPAVAEPSPPSLTREEVEALIDKKVAEKVAALEEARKSEDDARKKEEEAKKAAALAAAEQKKKEEEAAKSGIQEKRGMMAPSFLKNSLSFIIGDDNLRDESSYSPATNVGPRDEYDNFMNKFLGYSNRAKGTTRLTLFHESDGLIENLVTRIGIGFGMEHYINQASTLETRLIEGGSFLEVQYEKGFLLKLTAWPYDSDRMAVGFFPALRWGSTRSWPENSYGVPGAQLLFGWGPLSVYTGFKVHMQYMSDPLGTEFKKKETAYGAFGGVTYQDLGFTASLQGAFIDKGDNVYIAEAELADRKDDEILSYGLDLFTQYEWGKTIGDPLGLTSYNNGEWQEPVYDGPYAFRIRGELILLNERLQNADYLSWAEGDTLAVPPITANFWAPAGSVEAAFRWEHLRVFGLFTWRSLQFLTFDGPGLVPYQTFPKNGKILDELAGSFSVDYNWRMLWFGFATGIKTPASYLAPGSDQTMVVKDRLPIKDLAVFTGRNLETLPSGANPLNIAFYAFTVKAQLSESLMASFLFSFTKDSNRSKKIPDAETGNNLVFWDDEEIRNILSFYVSLEGRF